MKLPKLARRLGCGVLLALWFLLMLTPCAVIALATQGEIKLTYSDLPDDELRIWMISSSQARGIGISNSRRVIPALTVSEAPGSETMCQVINVSFVMWQGQGDPVQQCYCYGKDNGRWQTRAEGASACKLAGATR
jgi:hypothetical protein